MSFKGQYQYVIVWQSKTGYIGRGSPMNYEIANIWINYLKDEFPNIQHWIEMV